MHNPEIAIYVDGGMVQGVYTHDLPEGLTVTLFDDDVYGGCSPPEELLHKEVFNSLLEAIQRGWERHDWREACDPAEDDPRDGCSQCGDNTEGCVLRSNGHVLCDECAAEAMSA